MPPPKRPDNMWAQASRYGALGFVLPATTFAGYAAGYLLDKLFHTSFLWIVFLILGVAGGFVEVIREGKALANQNGQ
jgi:F0F1-type ATP synthase assembly protein I